MKPLHERFRHVAVEGALGVGKTALAERLAAELGAELVLDRPQENPYLERFYDDRAGYALQTQLSFLFQRLKQTRTLSQTGVFGAGVVSNFLLAKDAVYARLYLSDEEHRLYMQMYAQAAQVPPPDLVVWLQVDAASVAARLANRRLPMERRLSLDDLQRVVEAYDTFFSSYADAPVFAIAADGFDAGRDADFRAFMRALSTFEGERAVFQPHLEAVLAR